MLPNSLTPVIAFLPFRMSAAIVALTSLDFLGLGVPPSTPSLGELLAQGKANLDAWWISLPTFAVLVGTLMLLIFIGEALRDALDTQEGMSVPADTVRSGRRRGARAMRACCRSSVAVASTSRPPAAARAWSTDVSFTIAPRRDASRWSASRVPARR